MNELRTAAQQALEALELPCPRWNGTQSNIVNDAITALRAALAGPQSTHSAECYQWHHRCAVAEVERLRAALAEPVQNSHDFGVAGSATSPWRESAAKGCSPSGIGMPATPPQRPAEPVQEPLPFGIEERAGVRVLYSKDGSCRPATAEEWLMWRQMRAHEIWSEA